MASPAVSVSYQRSTQHDIPSLNVNLDHSLPVARSSLASGYPHPVVPQSHTAPPFEGIVDFTYSNVSSLLPGQNVHHPHELSLQQHHPMTQRLDGSTEWKQSSFFSYRPNEVKHRKRTTRQQLKVLEETFKTTQKPDGNTRKSLALQLNMTPRNVQVWFQNRRAKDKTLAKRAQRSSEDLMEKETHASLDCESVTVDSVVEGLSSPIGSHASVAHPQYASFTPSGPSSEADFQTPYGATHSGSLSPVDGTFPHQHDTPTSIHEDIVSHVISPTSSSHLDGAAQAMTSAFASVGDYDVKAVPQYPRDIYAHRGSLPHIHAPSFQQDLQHQRSNSSPAFPCNVDNASNLSMTTYASINGVLSMYPQRYPLSQTQAPSMYNSSFSALHVPSGPLPSSDYSFGQSTAHASIGGDGDRDVDIAPFGRLSHYSSASGSDTPSSISGLSHYGSVVSLADSEVNALSTHGYDEELAMPPLGWQTSQRRGSPSHAVQASQANLIARNLSPLSAGYASASPRQGATTPNEIESEASENALYISGRRNWTTPFAEESKPSIQHAAYNPQPAYMSTMNTQVYGQQAIVDTILAQPYGVEATYVADNGMPLGGFGHGVPSGYTYA
jgi:hypothetical protein